MDESLNQIPYFRQWNNVYRKRATANIDIDKKVSGDLFYTPKSNTVGKGNSQGHLLVTSPLRDVNFKIKPVGEMALSAAVNDANDYIFVGTQGLNDISTINLLKKKALNWRLTEVKAVNGESVKDSTCNSEKIFARQRKDLGSGGRAIVLSLPKNKDKELVSSLVTSGIDVCELEESVQQKIWAVDRKIAYIGSVNPEARSHRADMEMGIVVTDEAVIDDLYKRVFLMGLKESDASEARAPASELEPYAKSIRWFGNILRRW